MTGTARVLLAALSGCPASGLQTSAGCSWERVPLPEGSVPVRNFDLPMELAFS